MQQVCAAREEALRFIDVYYNGNRNADGIWPGCGKEIVNGVIATANIRL